MLQAVNGLIVDRGVPAQTVAAKTCGLAARVSYDSSPEGPFRLGAFFPGSPPKFSGLLQAPASPLDARFDPRLDVCRAALYGYTQNPGDPGGSSADSDEFCRIPSVARPNPHAAHGNAETESRLDTPLSITQPGHAAALPLLSPRPFTADRALAPPFRPAWHRPRAESGREPEAGGLPGT